MEVSIKLQETKGGLWSATIKVTGVSRQNMVSKIKYKESKDAALKAALIRLQVIYL